MKLYILFILPIISLWNINHCLAENFSSQNISTSVAVEIQQNSFISISNYTINASYSGIKWTGSNSQNLFFGDYNTAPGQARRISATLTNISFSATDNDLLTILAYNAPAGITTSSTATQLFPATGNNAPIITYTGNVGLIKLDLQVNYTGVKLDSQKEGSLVLTSADAM
jgi:hypothetical protein